MAHRITQINVGHRPAMLLKLIDDYPAEILSIYCVIGAKSRCVVVEDHLLIAVFCVVSAEVINECRQLPFELHIERFYHVQTVP